MDRNFVQFRPQRGHFVKNFNQRRPQLFQRMNTNMMAGGIQKRRMMGGQGTISNRLNFQQRQPLGQNRQQFVMQRGFVKQRPQSNFQQPRPFQQMNQQPFVWQGGFVQQGSQQVLGNRIQIMRQRQPQMTFQRNNFTGGQSFRQQNVDIPMQQNLSQNQPTKLYISNLDFGVTNQDVKELFSEFGPMVRYGVNFSAAGRSVGSAEVFFKNKISAIKAHQKYNGVSLDGRTMKLEVSGGTGTSVMQHQNHQVQRQNQPAMLTRQRLSQPMAGRWRNDRMKRMKSPSKVAAKQIVANAVWRNAIKNFGIKRALRNFEKQMGGQIMQSKMMMKSKKMSNVPNVEFQDADLEEYAES